MPRAVTHSSAINAWSLHEGCRQLGIPLLTRATAPELPLPRTGHSEDSDLLLFTEEASLRNALEHNQAGHYYPRTFPLALLDDKWAFASWLAAEELTPGIPQWQYGQAASARFPVFLKARHSWQGARKLPRGWICRDRHELAAAHAQLQAEGLSGDSFFLQQWLDTSPVSILSVCGFHDCAQPSRNLACIAERLAGYNDGPSCSSAVRTRPDEHGLIARTTAILDRLRYQGPYELEFIIHGADIYVIELNPRFWMQHGIFVAQGNGLLKRYADRDTPQDHVAPAPQKILWLDSIWLIRSLSRLDLSPLRLLWHWCVRQHYRLALCPAPYAAVFFLLQRVRRRWLQRGAKTNDTARPQAGKQP